VPGILGGGNPEAEESLDVERKADGGLATDTGRAALGGLAEEGGRPELWDEILELSLEELRLALIFS
jgi:hypothetical protein